MIETELRRAFRSRGMLVVVLVAVILAAGNLYSSLQWTGTLRRYGK